MVCPGEVASFKKIDMLNTSFIISLALSYIFGQLARVQLGNGVSFTLLDCTVVIFTAVFFIRFILKRRLQEIKSLLLFKPLVLFFVACLFSLVFNLTFLSMQELGISSLYLFRFFAYICAVFFIAFFSKQQKILLARMLAISVLITVGVGFMQFIYYPNLRNLYYLEWDDHLYRLFSVYLDPNFASVIFACLFLFLLGVAIKNVVRKDIKKGFIFGLLSAVTVLAIFLTYSRTGMITLTVGTITLLFIQGYKKFLLVCLAFFTLLLFLTADFKVEGLNPFRTVSTNARIESARIALTIFQKNPVVGVGFNAYRYAQHRYGFRPDDRWETSHADAGTDNSFLFVLATTGIIGFSCFLYFWYVLLRVSYIASKKKSGVFPPIVFATFIAVLASSIFLNTLFYPFILVLVFSFYAVMENKSP